MHHLQDQQDLSFTCFVTGEFTGSHTNAPQITESNSPSAIRGPPFSLDSVNVALHRGASRGTPKHQGRTASSLLFVIKVIRKTWVALLLGGSCAVNTRRTSVCALGAFTSALERDVYARIDRLFFRDFCVSREFSSAHAGYSPRPPRPIRRFSRRSAFLSPATTQVLP